MNRLEKFKLRRSLRRKYLSAALLFFFLLSAGLASADYATNALMSGYQGTKLFSIENRQTYLEIILMNQTIYINTQYINRDLERFRNELGKLKGI